MGLVERHSSCWTSSARGEGIVGGLNTINDAYTSAKSSSDGESLQAMKDRVAELETLQKLNKLENCAAILNNGGGSSARRSSWWPIR